MLYSSLIPALSVNATVRTPLNIGTIATGVTLTYADIISGTVAHEPGFPIGINATVIRGGDHLSIDPSQAFLRLNVDMMLQTDDNPPQYIRVQATGTEEGKQSILDAVSGADGAQPVPFGDFQATSSWTFETGSSKYAELQNTVYVGSTSFRPGEVNGTFHIGFRIAKVVSVKTNISV